MISGWMLLLPIPLLACTALVCWVLSRRVTTRRLGYGAASAVLVSLGLVLAAQFSAALPFEWSQRTWLAAYGIDPTPVALAQLAIRVDSFNSIFALVALAGGALGLLYLARSLASSLMGYGQLWSAILVMLTGVMIGLWANDGLIMVFGWGVTAVGTALARRTVGGATQRLPAALTTTLFGGLALLASMFALVVQPVSPAAAQYGLSFISSRMDLAAFGPLLVATLIALGLPPFSQVLIDDQGGPPALHGLLIGMGLPLLGSYILLRLFGLTLGTWPKDWLSVLGIVGSLGLLGGAIGAARAIRFGPLLGWQLSTQLGLAIFSLSQYDLARSPADLLNVSTLSAVLLICVCAAWSTLVAGLALAALERRSGSDELTRQPLLAAPLRVAGLAYGLAAATAIGLPPLAGFWSRRWLIDGIVVEQPWMFPVMVAGAGLLAISYLGPLALFWRVGPRPGSRNGTPDAWIIILGILPLVAFGVLPIVIWRAGVRPAISAILPSFVDPAQVRPSLPGVLELTIWIVALCGLVLAGLRGQSRASSAVWTGGEPLDRDDGTPHAPQAIAHTLRGLGLLADPRFILEASGRAIERISAALAWTLQIVSGRYYLTGVLIAALTLILLLVQ